MKISSILLLSLFVIGIKACSPSTKKEHTSEFEQSDKPKLMVTQSHGEWKNPARLNKLARDLGIEFIALKQEVTKELLKGIDVVYILMPSEEIGDKERSVLIEYIKGGGSMLLVQDSEKRQSISTTRANELIAPFGMELTDDTPYVHNCGAMAKKGEINKKDREIPYSGGRAVVGGTPFSYMLNEDGHPSDLVHGAYLEKANGSRIIVLSEGMASLFLGVEDGVRLTGTTVQDTKYWGKDSEIFNKELLEWLIRK